MRVALDTNVLVSAFATRGQCAEVVNFVLAEAVGGRAEVLITGDRDLLDITDDLPIRILTPRAFWELLVC